MIVMARLVAGLIALFSLLCVVVILFSILLAMNISYVGSSVAVPTGRVYSIFSMYDSTTDRRYFHDRMVRICLTRINSMLKYVILSDIVYNMA